jgi:hypothetical protein
MVIHFTRNCWQTSTTIIALGDGSHIEPSKEGEYLGIIFDK